MFGGGGMNPRKMEQMIKQMGIDVMEPDVEEVVIKTGDDEFVFSDAQVTCMDARDQETYQTVGESETRELGAGDDGDESVKSAESAEAADAISADDVAIVAQCAGIPENGAREALEAEDGDLAAAIARLE